jgi:hypothetical protein
VIAKPLSRLNSVKRRKKKLAVFNRDRGICQICKYPVTFEECALDHHPIKRRDGGSNNINNLRLTHEFCNMGIETHARTTIEARINEMSLTNDELGFLVAYMLHQNPESAIIALKLIEERRVSDSQEHQ